MQDYANGLLKGHPELGLGGRNRGVNEAMTIPANTRFGQYQIVALLGVGGMGEVYRAHDNRLDREVALKFLPADFTLDKDRVRRFFQEAKAASALNHPNIITIYDVGQEEGAHYIATELIDGQTLRSHCLEVGVSLTEALDIALQLASALVAAHEAGIVHRDIKPENVMLRRDGIVKVLDFGLAKLTEQRDPAGLDADAATRAKVTTAAGTVLGTPQYMSPEQARGQKTDARTDIFSLGVVLYEMLTGHPPFTGVNALEVISEILKSEPRTLESYVTDAPDELQRIISKALCKDRESRFQSAREIHADLKTLARELDFRTQQLAHVPQPGERVVRETSPNQIKPTDASPALPSTDGADPFKTSIPKSDAMSANSLRTRSKPKWLWPAVGLVVFAATLLAYRFLTAATPIESIAVIPFINETGNADLDYLSDGMTETLTNGLSQIPKLNVKARSSVFRYKGQVADVKTIGRELGVQAVLNGRIVQRNDELTLYLSLVDTETENQVWGRQYKRKLADLTTLQTEIARDVSASLKTTLSGADRQKLEKSYTTNAEAYTLYLQGRFHAGKRTSPDLLRSIDYYNRAIAIDPTYALAFAGLADSYTLLPSYRGATSAEVMPKAKDAVLKALSLDSDLAEAHTALGQILDSYDYDFVGAERAFTRALELNPNDATSHQYYGELLAQLGRREESLAQLRRAMEIDPLSLNINRIYGQVLYFARRYDEATEQFKKTLALDETFAPTHYALGKVYWKRGNHAEAVSEFGRMYELIGNRKDAEQIRESFAQRGWRGYLDLVTGESGARRSAHLVALNLVELGEKDKALAELERSYEQREAFHAYLKVEPLLDPLRGDPRFEAMLRRIGLTK